MIYNVMMVKTQTCVIETEAGCHLDAMKYVEMNVQLGQYTNLKWKDKEIYARDVEQIDD